MAKKKAAKKQPARRTRRAPSPTAVHVGDRVHVGRHIYRVEKIEVEAGTGAKVLHVRDPQPAAEASGVAEVQAG